MSTDNFDDFKRDFELAPSWAGAIHNPIKGSNGARDVEAKLDIPVVFAASEFEWKLPKPVGQAPGEPKAPRKSRGRKTAAPAKVASIGSESGNGASQEPWWCDPIAIEDAYRSSPAVDDVPLVTPEQAPATLQPDRAEAERFLKRLDPTAIGFTFQTFDDNKDRKAALPRGKKDPFARVRNGALDQLFEELSALNKDGAGIFVTVCETDLKGRQASNVERARLVFKSRRAPASSRNTALAHGGRDLARLRSAVLAPGLDLAHGLHCDPAGYRQALRQRPRPRSTASDAASRLHPPQDRGRCDQRTVPHPNRRDQRRRASGHDR